MGKERIHINFSIRNELRAVRLPVLTEGPRANKRYLPPQEVVGHVEGDVARFTHKARRPPGPDRLHRGAARFGVGAAIERFLRPFAMREIAIEGAWGP